MANNYADWPDRIIKRERSSSEPSHYTNRGLYLPYLVYVTPRITRDADGIPIPNLPSLLAEFQTRQLAMNFVDLFTLDGQRSIEWNRKLLYLRIDDATSSAESAILNITQENHTRCIFSDLDISDEREKNYLKMLFRRCLPCTFSFPHEGDDKYRGSISFEAKEYKELFLLCI